MTLLAKALDLETAPSVRVTDTPEGLSAIQSPECAASIWQRRPLPGFQSWVDALDPDQLPNARIMLRPEHVRDAATQIFETCGTPECSERDMLVDDTVALANLFAELMDASCLKLRFDVINTNGCRLFHVDAITARLICTYRGPGTQYGFSSGMVEPSKIFTVATGKPVLLRGGLWPESPRSGLLHRSPPIEGKGLTRLVLVLDPIAGPENETDEIVLH